MKFAALNGERIEPAPRLKAKCPFCESEVIARCGKIRVWHWAHKSTKHCDHWWEPEKEWHRTWKNLFPNEWQEQGRRDQDGELHIADVLTPQGLALEFQHSAIAREEVDKRTAFHKDICWIVDGMRLESTINQFMDALKHARPLNSSGAHVYEVYYYDSRFLKKWSGLNAPVVIDFGMDDVWVIGRSLENSALMYTLKKTALVEQFKQGNRPPPVQIQRTPQRRRHRGLRRF
ncbi:competence protein CoiA family protein [Ruegeria sp. 2205SS24-7]|uniref:competence protein CoiA n=1 Tax=Ruegeria discodermiae TaxID=3064389 RepID=UPI00274068D5|nr:competence protein CoiA family protein [Ruegeria sp. 2205SS24-7]MDP5219684.1 competence protein CoiA family protein [Ruegeria sp. 2205SS24-7]